MAAIIKRNNSYAVVYRTIVASGTHKQIWETYDTLEKAQIRKQEVENPLPFLGIKCYVNTLSVLLDEYIELHGKAKWSLSTYSANLSLINRYIKPLIGNAKLSMITPHLMSRYYHQLEQTPVARNNYSPKNTSVLTSCTIYEIHELLRSLFNLSVHWGYFEESPVRHIKIKKPPGTQTKMLTPEELKLAINYVIQTDTLLSIALQLTLNGSLRKGELLGLTWGNIDYENKVIHINKELACISLQALQELNQKDTIHVFHPQKASAKTRMILKTPKTVISVRVVYAPDPLLQNLQAWEKLSRSKNTTGKEISDCGLLFTYSPGYPLQGKELNNRFYSALEDCGLPKVTFRSLRHTSTSYKLALSGGNIKAVQGDTGHAQAKMILNIYAQTIDEERKTLANSISNGYYPSLNNMHSEGSQNVLTESQEIINVPLTKNVSKTLAKAALL